MLLQLQLTTSEILHKKRRKKKKKKKHLLHERLLKVKNECDGL